MEKDSTIYVAGASGMVGSAVVRKLQANGYTNIITERINLINQLTVNLFFTTIRPEYIFLVAGKVGGIKANNTYRAEFIFNNLMIGANTVHAAHIFGVKKLLYVGSSCIYPKDCQQPIKEDYLLTGELEPTNEPYAIAKIATIKMCQAYNHQYGCNFISAIPCNSYGLNDNYDLENSHVLPALIRKIITAKEKNFPIVEVWGTGLVQREFIYVDDMADALVFLMDNYDSPEVINVGMGFDVTIWRLADTIKDMVGWDGVFSYNGELDGMKKKLMSAEKINSLGWYAKTDLLVGLKLTIDDIYKNEKHLKWL